MGQAASVTVEASPKAGSDRAGQTGSLPRGHREKRAWRLLIEHPLDQLKLFVGVPVLKAARRNANRQAIQGDEETVGRLGHRPS